MEFKIFAPDYLFYLGTVLSWIYVVLLFRVVIQLIKNEQKENLIENIIYLTISIVIFGIRIYYPLDYSLFLDENGIGSSAVHVYPFEIDGYPITPLVTVALVFLNRVKVIDKKTK